MAAALCAAAIAGSAADASAQLDPLLFVKRTQPNVIIAVDVANRMQRDADEAYYDPWDYLKRGDAWELPLGVTGETTTSRYRRIYRSLVHLDAGGGDKFGADEIKTVGDRNGGYANFWARTRLGVARAGVLAALQQNTRVARFGIIKMRQSSPRLDGERNEGPVWVTSMMQQTPTETGSLAGRWLITRPVVDETNGTIMVAAAPLVAADSAAANTNVATLLGKTVNQAGALLPAGRDSKIDEDAPLANLIADARAEAARLIAADTQCRNTVVILVTGGGEGTTTPGADPSARAATFLNVGGRRVPIYVIAIAPEAGDADQLREIARNSGGGYYEITKAMIEAVPSGTTVPEVVRAANAAIQHAFAAPADVNAPPTPELPLGPLTEWPTSSPIVGTVNLENGRSISGAVLPNTIISTPAGTEVPQRANVMITTGTTLPGFEGRLRGFRMYKPEPDATKPYGWAFVSDGTRLWVSALPAPATRNIYTTLPTGAMVPLTAANAPLLASYLNTSDPAALIELVRSQPLGAIVSSTPAVLDPPSLDPPPDAEYPAFAVKLQSRRTLIFVGANDGMLHAFRGDTGEEAWAFVPQFALPKLKVLADSSYCHSYTCDLTCSVKDVKLGDVWKTVLVSGGREGGSAYFALDVTDPLSPEVLWQTDLPANNQSFSEAEFAFVGGAPVVLVGSGLDASGGTAKLTVLDLATGVVEGTRTLSAAAGTRNKCTTPKAVDEDLDGVTDVVYCGDMRGNLWRCAPDEDPDPNAWGVTRLFQQSREITAQPAVAYGENGRMLVYFGTGAYLASADLTTTAQNSFYCVHDEGDGSSLQRADLRDQSDDPGELSGSDRGWFVDLWNQAAGERVTEKAVIVANTVYFTSFAPSSSPCEAGGRSWLYHLKYDNGGEPEVDEEHEETSAAERSEELGEGVASRPVVDIVNENIIVQSSDATIAVQDIGSEIFHLTVRSWQENYDFSAGADSVTAYP
jgi:outer membrane protein assembly factor BamB